MTGGNGRPIKVWWLLAGLPFLVGWLGWLTEGHIRYRSQLQANDVFHQNMHRRVSNIERFNGEGRRFTQADGDRVEAILDDYLERIAQLERSMEDLRR